MVLKHTTNITSDFFFFDTLSSQALSLCDSIGSVHLNIRFQIGAFIRDCRRQQYGGFGVRTITSAFIDVHAEANALCPFLRLPGGK
jgi:hypothetical protein